jgi:hypothetical protein
LGRMFEIDACYLHFDREPVVTSLVIQNSFLGHRYGLGA